MCYLRNILHVLEMLLICHELPCGLLWLQLPVETTKLSISRFVSCAFREICFIITEKRVAHVQMSCM